MSRKMSKKEAGRRGAEVRWGLASQGEGKAGRRGVRSRRARGRVKSRKD